MSAEYLDPRPRAVLRPVRASDAAAISDFLAGLSLETAYRRFFTGGRPSPAQVSRLVEVDHVQRDTWLATVGTEVVAAANYVRGKDGLAEFAIVVADDWQRQGLGTRLLAQLLGVARSRGIPAMRATILAENRRMLKVIRQFWPQARPEPRHPDGDASVVEYLLPMRGVGRLP
jgi:GNAT superfamily N-acetyltransferase